MAMKNFSRNLRTSKIDSLKVPPHSIEAEQSILGGLMIDNQAWDKIADRLSDVDFYRSDHRLVFNAIFSLVNRSKPFDVITLAEELKTKGNLDKIGDDTYLFELVNNTPSSANIAAYADIVREKSTLRRLIGVANELTENVYNPDGRESAELLDEAERSVFSIANERSHGDGAKSIKKLLVGTIERIDTLFHSKESITGLSTGFTDLDEKTSGLQPADLIVVAGRPSMGKTAFAMNIAEYAAIELKKPVLVFSMEMPGEAIAMRMLSSLSRIDQNNVRTARLTDKDWPRITSSVGILSDSPLFIDDAPSLSPSELRARARRLHRETNGELGLIVIDYLQLMHVPGSRENRSTEISEISRNLKALAKELNVPVMALSQLNRSLEMRTDKRPVMSDLRESGAIEQDADLITFIYRDEVYNENSPDKGKAEILIAKQRNGPIGKIALTFLGKYTRFENYARGSWAP